MCIVVVDDDDDSHSGVKWTLTVVAIFLALMTNEDEHDFHKFNDQLYFFLEKYLFRSFAHFLSESFVWGK